MDQNQTNLAFEVASTSARSSPFEQAATVASSPAGVVALIIGCPRERIKKFSCYESTTEIKTATSIM